MVVAAGLAWAPDAPLQETRPTRGLVIVLRPSEVDALTQTALARVIGELTAARFQVTVVPLDPGEDPTAQVEEVAPESHAVAAFAIDHMADSNGDTIAIWVCDRLGRRTTIQRMAIRGKDVSQDAEALALEAIELIRVSVAGLWPVAPSSGVTSGASLPTTRAPPVRRDRPEVALGMGVAMLKDLGVPSQQWMGTLTATVTLRRRLGARLYLGGLGPAQTLSGARGTAKVQRQIGSMGLFWIFWANDGVRVWLSIAGGAEHLSAAGASPESSRGTHALGAWSAQASTGLGATAQIFSWVSFTANVEGLWTWPAVDLLIDETRTGPFSRPGVLMNGGLLATF
jgi:hypothetical protein